MNLFHGTSRVAWRSIAASGALCEPAFLTPCIEVARHYAKAAVIRTGGEIAILKVDVAGLPLEMDEMSLLDPIFPVVRHMKIDDTMAYLEQLAEYDPDRWYWDLADAYALRAQYPWQISLELGLAVRVDQPIDLSRVCLLG